MTAPALGVGQYVDPVQSGLSCPGRPPWAVALRQRAPAMKSFSRVDPEKRHDATERVGGPPTGSPSSLVITRRHPGTLIGSARVERFTMSRRF